MFGLLLCVSVVFGHNWINTPSRAETIGRLALMSGTYFPCLDPKTSVQVNKDQMFQIEWSTGHDGFVYFTLLSKSDSSYLAQLTPEVLEDYIAKAPQLANYGQLHFAKYFR